MILLDIAGVSGEDLLSDVVNSFSQGEDKVGDFINHFNSLHPSSPITALSEGSIDEILLDLAEQINNIPSLDYFETIFNDFIAYGRSIEGQFENLFSTLKERFSDVDLNTILQLFIPEVGFSLNDISLGLKFPTHVLKRIDETTSEPLKDEEGNEVPSILKFTAGKVSYNTAVGFKFENESSLTLPKSQIGQTGLTLDVKKMKLDLSDKTNIPEATAAGYSNDFKGVYAQFLEIGLPAKWFEKQEPEDEESETLAIFGRNILIGTGGISGTVGLEVVQAYDPETDETPPPPLPPEAPAPGEDPVELKFKLGENLIIGFSEFTMEFKQSEIVKSTVKGSITVPKLTDANDEEARFNIEAFFGNDGDFSIKTKIDNGYILKYKNYFEFNVFEASVGRVDEHFYFEVTGTLHFPEDTAVGEVLKSDLEIKKLRIWDNGRMEIQGGKIPIPLPKPIKLGPAEISITAIHFGSHQQKLGDVMRKYNYFGFDGGVSVNPGGVDASGDGIKYYYTVDNDEHDNTGDSFIKIDSLRLELVIPGTASKDAATAIIEGYIAIKNEGGAPGSSRDGR
ncbi:MAG: hypothetical protein ACKOXB_11075 [Flavobacteriales bacterium]